jgi:hypothetical protein
MTSEGYFRPSFDIPHLLLLLATLPKNKFRTTLDSHFPQKQRKIQLCKAINPFLVQIFFVFRPLKVTLSAQKKNYMENILNGVQC